jgi:two-component system chemotaxis response regulator CheY
MRIMVVDDAAFMRCVIKSIIEKTEHEVIGEATNGKEALDKYKEVRPDLVTMDITMPDYSGIDGVKFIKKFDNNAKIIMVSAMGQKEMVLEAIQEGAIDFIVKPFTADKLIETINKALGGR